MKKAVYLILFMLTLSQLNAQKCKLYQTDPKNGKSMLVGKIKRQHLESRDFKDWFNAEYSAYTPDQETLLKLKPLLKNVRIVLVMATWCSDSRREVPRFYQILDQAGFTSKHMKVLSVDRDKKAGKFKTSDLNVTLVPTFIIYRKGREIGRIVETPVESLEKDLLNILLKS